MGMSTYRVPHSAGIVVDGKLETVLLWFLVKWVLGMLSMTFV